MLSAIKQTAKNTGLVLNLALNYGGRTEILEAVKRIAGDVKHGRISPKRIDEELDTWTVIDSNRKSVIYHNDKETAITNLKSMASELRAILSK